MTFMNLLLYQNWKLRCYKCDEKLPPGEATCESCNYWTAEAFESIFQVRVVNGIRERFMRDAFEVMIEQGFMQPKKIKKNLQCAWEMANENLAEYVAEQFCTEYK